MIQIKELTKKLKARGYKVGDKVSLGAAEEAGLINRALAVGTEEGKQKTVKIKRGPWWREDSV